MLSYVIVTLEFEPLRNEFGGAWNMRCVFWRVENQMVSVILALEKSNIREDGFFIPIPLFFLWLTCSIASAEIFISIYRESFGLTSKSQLDFEIFIFVPLFCVMMVYWKRKDEDGSWKSITISWQNQDLFLCSTLGKNPKKSYHANSSSKSSIYRVSNWIYKLCLWVPRFKCNCEKSRFTPPLPFSSIYKLINKEALF